MAENEYIRKAQVKRAFGRLLNDERSANEIFQSGFEYGVNLAWLKIENMPAADVAPVTHGTLQHTGSAWSHLWRCTNCDKIAYYPPKGNRKKRIIQPCNYNYCPNCGAKMDGKDG